MWHPKTVEQALGSPAKYTATKNMAKDELTEKQLNVKKEFLDVTELIRSTQRAEGNIDCFRRGQDYCDEPDCAWRSYCLESRQTPGGEEI
jgi:hypothetical protein